LDTKGEDHCADDIRYFLMSLHESKTQRPLNAVERKLQIMKQGTTDNTFYYGT